MPKRHCSEAFYGRKIEVGLLGKSVEEILIKRKEQIEIFRAEDPNFTWDSDEDFHVENNMNEFSQEDIQYNEAEEFISSPVPSRSYVEKISNKLQQWAKILCNNIFGLLLKSRTVAGRQCSFLNCQNKANSRCRNCVKDSCFCLEHGILHCNAYSHALKTVDGIYICNKQQLVIDRDAAIVLITHGGWFYETSKSAEKLLEEHIWFPLTPDRPTVFIHHELMEAVSNLSSGTMISCDAIMDFIESYFSVPPPIKWRSNFGEALRHYAAVKMMIDNGKTVTDFIKGNLDCRKYCPACFSDPEDSGTIIMTMDGCFSFKRYNGHATKIGAPLLNQSVFLNGPDLKHPINSSRSSCSQFRSGDIKRKQNEYCDISGMFGGICVHGLIFGLINIPKGESLDYSLQMTSFVREIAPKARLIVAYDLFCKISQKDSFKRLADGGFIPAMHALNHVDDCRGEFDPSRKLGIGREDGEDSERAWSAINKISAQTSVMRVENREDMISLAVDKYNETMIFNLVERIKNDLKQCRTSLEEIIGRKDLNSIKSYSLIEKELIGANENLLAESISRTKKDATSKFISEVKYIVRRIKALRRQTKKKVGANMVQEIYNKIDGLRQKLETKLDNFNCQKEVEDVVTEDMLFSRIDEIDLPENLRDQVLFWKNIEQICLSKQSLGRMIYNFSKSSKLDLNDPKYEGFRSEYGEILNIHHSRYLRLQADAIELLNDISTMFSSDILEKVNQVSFALTKQ